MDYYKILGLSRTASAEEIQQAYRELALKHHPDANQGDPQAAEKFKEINRAYQVLRHAEKRKEYDLTLNGTRAAATQRPQSATRPPGATGGTPTSSYATGNPLADILGDLRNAARAGADTQSVSPEGGEDDKSSTPLIEIKLTRREAVTGATKTILVNGRRLRIKISVMP